MRIWTSASFLVLLAVSLTFAQPQQSAGGDSCKFTVHGEPVSAAISGPEDLVPLVYVMDQPDSPLEILSVDLTGTSIWTTGDRLNHKDCAKYRVRNRSDKPIGESFVEIGLGSGGSGSVKNWPLAPGQTAEIRVCGTYGSFSGGQPIEHFRLIVWVDSVDLGGCLYQPSLRIPRNLGLTLP